MYLFKKTNTRQNRGTHDVTSDEYIEKVLFFTPDIQHQIKKSY